MKITISRNQYPVSAGFFKKTTEHCISAEILLSDEEIAIIKQHHLEETVVCEYESGIAEIPVFTCKLGGLAGKSKNITKRSRNPLDLDLFERELREDILPNLKNYLQRYAQTSTGPTSDSFEL